MRNLLLLIVIPAGIIVCSGNIFARTASCPCPNPCPCAPCTCGQSKSNSSKPKPAKNPSSSKPQTERPATQSRPHEATREHEHDHGHGHGGGSVGVGVNVDLSGIGQRRPEANPFAVPSGPQPVAARTEEKPKATKKPREAAKTDPFADVQLTGEQAKEKN